MYRRLTAGLAALTLVGCAHETPKPEGAAPAQPTQSQEKISNLVPFDLYNCFPRKVNVPAPPNQVGVTALWAAAQPQIQECLIDPKSRGPQDKTTVTVDFNVTEQGAQSNVTGQNISPEGQKCIEQALANAGQVPSVEAGGKPVAAKLEAQHVLGQSPAVQFGLNDVSDIAGTIRLAQKNWCECFQPYRVASPDLLKAKVDVKAGDKGDQATVSFDTTGASPTAQQVASCLQPKIQALKFPQIHSSEIGLTYPFLLINSASEQTLKPDAQPNLAFLQLDGVRAQKQANTALALAHRQNAVEAYDLVVRKYKADKKHGGVTVNELVTKCQAMVKADDAWGDAIAAQQATDQKTVDFAKQLAAKDPQWSRVVEAAQKQVTDDGNDLSRAKTTHTRDESVCPKVHY